MAEGADSLGISAPPFGSCSGPSLSGCSWWGFHEVAFYCCERWREDVLRTARQELPGKHSPA